MNVMKRHLFALSVSTLIAPAFCLAAHVSPDEVVLENAEFRLVVGVDAVARSLVVKKSGEECLADGVSLPLFAATQDRPFNNEMKLIHPNKRTTCPASSLRLADGFLIVGFPHRMYEAKVRVKVAPSYLAFELVDFICDRKTTYDYLKMDIPPVASFRVLQFPVAESGSTSALVIYFRPSALLAALTATCPVTALSAALCTQRIALHKYLCLCVIGPIVGITDELQT